MKKEKSLGIFIKVTVPVIVLAVVLFIKFSVTSKKDDFSVARYVIVTVEGVNGRGRATLTLDEIGLMNALYGNEMTESDKSEFEKFAATISYSGDTTDKLSNGDSVVITVRYDGDMAEQLGIRDGESSRTYRVSGLKDGTGLDAFSDVQIVTNGVSPFVTVKCENQSTHEYLKKLEYEVDREKGNAEGDTVTITCKADKADAAENGYYFDKLTLKYTISGTDRYVSSPEEIDPDLYYGIAKDAAKVIGEITDETTSHITYEITGNKSFLYRDGNEEAVDFSLYKVELAYNSTRVAARHQNYMLVYMKGQIRIPDYSGSEDPYEYIDAYFCFVYSDAIITKDGEFIMDTDNIRQRYICAATYDMALNEAESMIGPGFEYTDVCYG